MKKQDVPQDNNRTYGGHKKVIYAVDEAGRYQTVDSTGWEAEEFATLMAVDALNSLALDAYYRVKSGQSSPLEYHMYARRLDLLGLAQATGFYQWQIKRHIKPRIFSRLSMNKLQRYMDVLKLTAAELTAIPEKAPTP